MQKQLLGLVALSAGVQSAHAAIPPEATAAFTALQSDATSLLASGWGIAAVVVGGLILFKLFKKVMGRAT